MNQPRNNRINRFKKNQGRRFVRLPKYPESDARKRELNIAIHKLSRSENKIDWGSETEFENENEYVIQAEPETTPEYPPEWTYSDWNPRCMQKPWVHEEHIDALTTMFPFGLFPSNEELEEMEQRRLEQLQAEYPLGPGW